MTLTETIIIFCILFFIFNPKNGMGWIKEFNELSLSVKSIIITLFITMPFWFVILYLYFPSLLQNDWYKIMGFCFVPCVAWYLLTLGTSFLFSLFWGIKRDDFLKDFDFWIATAIDTIIYLIVIAVLLIILNIRFEYFVLILFGYKISALFLLKPIARNLKKIV